MRLDSLLGLPGGDISTFNGVPLSISLRDSLQNLVPDANLLLRFEFGLIVLETGEDGKIIIKFDDLLLKKNPTIFCQKDGNALVPSIASGNQKEEIPEFELKTGAEFQFPLRLAVEKFGGGDIYQFEGIPFEYSTEVTENNKKKLLPYANLIWRFTEGKMSIQTDEEGKIVVTVDRGIVKENPKLFVEKNGTRYTLGVSYSFSGEVEVSKKTSRKPSKIDIKKLELLRVGEDLVYYPSDHMELASQVANFVPRMRETIQDVLGIPPAPFGIVLSDKPEPLFLSTTTVQIGGKEVFLAPPVSIPDGSPQEWYLSPVHEWAHPTLDLMGTDKTSFSGRWVEDGLAELAKIKFLFSLSPSDRETMGLTPELIQKGIQSYQGLLKKFLDQGTKTYDLLSWPPPSREEPEFQVLGYVMSLYFWMEVEKEYGGETIRNIVQKAIELDEPTDKVLINLLANLTGEDMVEALKNVPLEKALERSRTLYDEIVK